ncbi:glycoside hydrolase family 108 protein [Xanthobacteraceae bacterium Astr-EGSB]|uniref:glycoside hydrolase family 108 protein n=1 Tax=Astrobacterium formosum TaxID=3069710 RepID=UPI0027B062CD|nr:glycoside hydrolase family 108 protein [Xanthobacteraceae bacterium Astr-EGSB]
MTSGNFAAALKRVLAHEGGYSNHPKDPGGATMKGVIQRVYDAFRDRKGLARQSVRLISDAELKDIYRRQYWGAIRGDELPSGLDYCVFDGTVNSGPGQAAKWLQRALGVAVDGHIGDLTIERAGAADPAALINSICDQRLAFLKRLRTWSTFGPGWGKRVTDVRRAALAMAEGAKVPAPVVLLAEETGKATEADLPASATVEGRAGEEQAKVLTSGGLFGSIVSYYQQASEFLSGITGLPEQVSKWVIAALAAAALAALIIVVARSLYGLARVWIEKVADEHRREVAAREERFT